MTDTLLFSFDVCLITDLVLLTQFMETLSEVIPEKSPLSWNKSVRPISFKFAIKS